MNCFGALWHQKGELAVVFGLVPRVDPLDQPRQRDRGSSESNHWAYSLANWVEALLWSQEFVLGTGKEQEPTVTIVLYILLCLAWHTCRCSLTIGLALKPGQSLPTRRGTSSSCIRPTSSGHSPRHPPIQTSAAGTSWTFLWTQQTTRLLQLWMALGRAEGQTRVMVLHESSRTVMGLQSRGTLVKVLFY